jgi:pimeloyl-ACP methyl ester carboxylesterase
MASSEKFLQRSDSTKICYQTFGSASDPAILLLAGGAQSMLSWPEKFISLLNKTANPHFIIRYDIRDTGRSTSYPVSADGKSNYSFQDLAEDAVAILDELKLDAAHMVGFSLGGGLAWYIAGSVAPHRVKSLTLLSTTPVGPFSGHLEGLPSLNPELQAQIAASPFPSDWHNKEQVVDFLMYFNKCMSFIPPTSDEAAELRETAGKVFERAEMAGGSVQRIFNQAGAAQARWPRETLQDIKCRTVVIHGRHDRNVSLPHGEALHNEIKGSKLVIVEDIAHEMPPRMWPQVVEEIIEITTDKTSK